MSVAAELTAFDKVTAEVVEVLSVKQARQIVAWRPSARLRARLRKLAERANEGELTEEERAEYEGYVRANGFLSALQARARRFLEQRAKA